MLTFKNLAGNFRLIKTLGTTFKKRVNLGTLILMGGRGQKKIKIFPYYKKGKSLKEDRLTPKVSFYLGTLLVNFAYSL